MTTGSKSSRDRPGNTVPRLSKQWREAFVAFAQASTDAFVLFDENLNVLTMNAAAGKLAGLSGVAAQGGDGDNILDHVPDLMEKGRYEKYLDVIRTGEPFSDDDHVVHRENGEMYLNIRAFKVGTGLGIIVNDITGRKEAEKALQESENNYKVLFESQIESTVVIDAETMKVVLANRAVAENFGLDSVEDALVTDLLDCIHPDDRARALKTIVDDMFEKDLRQFNEFRIITGEGSERWVEAVGSRIEYQGRTAGLVSFRDITERKEAGKVLRQSEDNYRYLLNSLNDAVCVVDVETLNLVMGNQKGAELYGLSSVEEGIGTSLLDYIYPEDRETVLNYFAADLGKEQRQRYEIRTKTKDGREIWVGVLATRIEFQGKKCVLLSARDITGQKRAREQLEESERRYRDLADLLPLSVFEVNANGVLTFFNRKCVESSGYMRNEMDGDFSVFQLLVPEDRERAKRNLREILTGDNSVGTEYTAMRKDGTVFPVLVYSSAILRDGEPAGLRCIALDLTERKRAEQELRESEQRLNRYLDGALDGIYTIDAKGRFLYVNKAMKRIFGYTKKEMLGKSFVELDLVPREYIARGLQVLKRIIAGNSAAAEEFEFKRKDGGRIFAEVSSFPLSRGDDMEIIAVVRDITRRKKAEDALRKSEERFRNVLDSSLDHVYRLDLRTSTYDYVSPACLDVLGYTPEEYMSMNIQEAFALVHPDDVPLLIDNALSLVSGPEGEERARILEYRVNHRTKGYRWMTDQRSVVYGEGGRPVAVVGSLRDITDQKRAEEALRKQLEFEKLFAHISTKFVNLPAAGVERQVEEVLRMLVIYLGVERSTLFELTDDGEHYCPTHSWAIEGVEPLPLNMISDLLPYCAGRIFRGEAFAFSRLDDMPEEAAVDKDIFFLGGMKSNLTLPLQVGDSVLGALAFGTLHYERDWPDELVQRLRLVADVLANALERKRTEEALHASEEKLRLMFESVSDGITVTDLEGIIVDTNSRGVEMYGTVSREALLGKSAFDLIAREEKERAVSAMQWTLEKGRSGVIEHTLLKEDGSRYPGELSVSVLHDACGMPVGFIGVIRDITERKWVEEELFRYRQRLEELVQERTSELSSANIRLKEEIEERRRTEEAVREAKEFNDKIMESMIDGLSVVKIDGTRIAVNDALCEMTGFSRDELLSEYPGPYWPPEMYEDIIQNLRRVYVGEIAEFETLLMKKNGERFPAIVSESLLNDEQGEALFFVGTIKDITERKRAEDKLKRHYGRERKLRHRLEEEMTKRIEFTRALAHELKTPLTPVVMSSQILTQELKDNKILLRVAENINRGAYNLSCRIDELLDLARGEVGMLTIKPERMDMVSLLREIVDEIGPVPLSRGQTLKAKLPPAMPPVLPEINADRGRVKQIVMNLLNNAFKYTPEGGDIFLNVRQDDSSIIVEVKDTGPGLPRKEQQRIFDPYHRVDRDRERLSGLGLGLALCRKLAGLHGGEIWVTSRSGKGSTFSLSLPIAGP